MNLDLTETELSRKIYSIRGHRVMLDSDLAHLYEVETRILNQAVRRNIDRFPDDFMYQLTLDEFEVLKSQSTISKIEARGGRQKLPLVFTEQGVAMLSGVLNSQRAVHVNIAIMRTFVKTRQMLATNKDLAQKLSLLERKYDHQFKAVFDAIRQLMQPDPTTPRKRIKGLNSE